MRSPCSGCSGETFVPPSRYVFLCSTFWDRFSRWLHILGAADLLRKICPSPGAAKFLKHWPWAILEMWPHLSSFRITISSSKSLAWPDFSIVVNPCSARCCLGKHAVLSQNNFILCSGLKPRGHSYRLIEMFSLLWEHTGVGLKGIPETDKNKATCLAPC